MSFLNLFNPTPSPVSEPGEAIKPQPTIPEPAGTADINAATPTVKPVETPGTSANGVVPDNVQTEVSPLDQFKDLWQDAPEAQRKQEFMPEQLDATKLQEVVSKTNMLNVVTPELQARINAGGEDAQKATMEAMNAVAQNALMQSTNVANKMMSSQATKLMEYMSAKLPDMVRDQNLTNNLHESNPIFKNPAVAPIIAATTSQLQVKFPNASAQELTKMAQDYVVAMSESLNPAKPPPSALDKEVDWTGFELES